MLKEGGRGVVGESEIKSWCLAVPAFINLWWGSINQKFSGAHWTSIPARSVSVKPVRNLIALACPHVCTCAHTNLHTHKHVHRHIHTNTQKRLQKSWWLLFVYVFSFVFEFCSPSHQYPASLSTFWRWQRQLWNWAFELGIQLARVFLQQLLQTVEKGKTVLSLLQSQLWTQNPSQVRTGLRESCCRATAIEGLPSKQACTQGSLKGIEVKTPLVTEWFIEGVTEESMVPGQ